jgi:hypothetical protein
VKFPPLGVGEGVTFGGVGVGVVRIGVGDGVAATGVGDGVTWIGVGDGVTCTGVGEGVALIGVGDGVARIGVGDGVTLIGVGVGFSGVGVGVGVAGPPGMIGDTDVPLPPLQAIAPAATPRSNTERRKFDKDKSTEPRELPNRRTEGTFAASFPSRNGPVAIRGGRCVSAHQLRR